MNLFANLQISTLVQQIHWRKTMSKIQRLTYRQQHADPKQVTL